MDKQTRQRLWHTVRLWMIPNSGRRAEYIKQHHIFHQIGSGCTIMERKVPLYPHLISIGNNVHLASKVFLIPHDAIHLCLNSSNDTGGYLFEEKVGCIEIGDNVFIGSNTTILYNVRIGSNVIVGARSLVNKDIPDNSIVVGSPARVIEKFDDFVKKRKMTQTYPSNFKPTEHGITKELEDWCGNEFNTSRK